MKNREKLEQELLELIFDCHPDPLPLRERIANEPEVAALYEKVKATGRVLNEAAVDEGGDLRLPVPERTRLAGPLGRRFPTPLRKYAALTAALLLLCASLTWGWCSLKAHWARRDCLRLSVTVPGRLNDLAPFKAQVVTRNLLSANSRATIRWSVLDRDGEVILESEKESAGTLQIQVPAGDRTPASLRVLASADGSTQETTVDLDQGRRVPVIHLGTDKPVYRPGEQIMFRAVFLDPLTLDKCRRPKHTRLRIQDAKGGTVKEINCATTKGVCGDIWQTGDDLAEGRYTLQVFNSRTGQVLERHRFLVRRFQAPRLAKKVDLNRETYAPGSAGCAAVRVRRADGKPAAGAGLLASIVIDGKQAWSHRASADGRGRALFRFTIPQRVERGEARFLLRVRDGGLVETEVEPFVVPTGRLQVRFYPEGGDLAADTESRIYAEITDPLDRPISAKGHLEDDRGRRVGGFITLHQGRARFTHRPEPGRSYQLVLTEPRAGTFPLPKPKAGAVALRTLQDRTRQGEPLAVRVHTPREGKWSLGVFRRGNLLARTAFAGGGRHDLSVELPPYASGVLRLTVFDAANRPLAERLVHRARHERIQVALTAKHATLAPGRSQEVTLRTTDEEGRPVATTLGVIVTDQTVRNLLGRPRVGLADQAHLLADVEHLEKVEDFLGEGLDAQRNVDLLLGTRGWRRFAWQVDTPELVSAFVEREGPRAEQLLAKEGQPPRPPLVVPDRASWQRILGAQDREIDDYGRTAATAGRVALGTLAAGVLLFLLEGLLVSLLAGFGQGVRKLGVVGITTIMATGGLLLAVILPNIFSATSDVVFVENTIADEVTMETGMPFPEMTFNLVDRNRERLEPAQAPPPSEEILGDVEIEETSPIPIPGARTSLLLVEDETQEQPGGLRLRRIYAHKHRTGARRQDFTETVYWNSLLTTDREGRATINFDTSDSVTTWSVYADAHGSGRVGQARLDFHTRLPFALDLKLPAEVSEGDRLRLPVAITAESGEDTEVDLHCRSWGPLEIVGAARQKVRIRGGRGRAFVEVKVTGMAAKAGLSVAGSCGPWADKVGDRIGIAPRGFPRRIDRGGLLGGRNEWDVPVPENHRPGTMRSHLQVYPSSLATIRSGLESIVRAPHGCFEQTSSANYPNVMFITFIGEMGIETPEAERRARTYLASGYRRLKGFECSGGGFEWFGQGRGHTALTAYGLMQFHDMSRVYEEVEPELLARTRRWLLDRRDGKGLYANRPGQWAFRHTPADTLAAYTTYALLTAGEPAANLETELNRLADRVDKTGDAYELALATRALQLAGRRTPARGGVERLVAMQTANGCIPGTTSITGSGGGGLLVESTAMAMLALLESTGNTGAVTRAFQYLVKQRGSYGGFGSSQSTVMALKALTAYARRNRGEVEGSGSIRVYANEQLIGSSRYSPTDLKPVEIPDLNTNLHKGNNRVRVEIEGEGRVPYSFGLSYHSDKPADDPSCPLQLETRLDKSRVEEGGQVALHVRLTNKSRKPLPMSMAMIGLPAGLETDAKVLDALVKARKVAFWELQGRVLVLYWVGLEEGATQDLTIDLIARIPGSSVGPASRCYLYYTPEQKRWNDPLRIEVTAAE